ncbi:TetR family transcriptional regulator [Streptomyces sp. NBC_00320]|uniref:TetR/AcrR family transcriptional regulator n=1 Tax=Streptomyces sp. NBC_00320 TaxID=2975711 RepID=UPI000AC28B15|nr:TetR family transcriptional regulator [Streptomyces sp. NBC_00320]MCX5148411.1 TetR family transcriptional regulator [Streptomyces sp. NBC_00320]
MAPAGAGGRRYDPDRRQRIIDAAIRVVGAKGIAGLSHRTVAAEADVPLGSTTYHFKTLDDLLVAALRQANAGFVPVPDVDDPDLARALARLLGEFLTADRARAELEYELYLEALRRPALRPVAAEWTESVSAALTHRVDPRTARALAAVMDGISLQVLLTATEYDEPYTREILARILKSGPAGNSGPAGA